MRAWWAPCGGVPCGFLCGCGPFSPCRCALHSPCGFWWLAGVRWCDPYGVRCLLPRCLLGGAPPGVVGRLVGLGRCRSSRRGMPFLGVGRGVCRGALFLRALVPASAPFLVLGWFPAPMWCLFWRPVPVSACPHLGPLGAFLPECPLVFPALCLPLSSPFLVWWWREGRGGEGAPAAQAWGWVAWSHWRRA